VGNTMVHMFTKFDPRAFLEGEQPPPIPAKAANSAKAAAEDVASLASLATLAAGRSSSRIPEPVPTANVIAPSPWFERFVPPMELEPSFSVPCIARRGRVEERERVLLHFCVECGRWGAFGYGVSLRTGRVGRWYCTAHRPRGGAP
jgi:hypothetical protein